MSEPIGLSTAWNGPGDSPQHLLEQHRSLGFRRLEAYAHFLPDQLRALSAAARERDMEIASLHGPCPVPTDGNGARRAYGDWLASPNPTERTAAVDAHKRSIDFAVEVGARAIVVHLGNTGAFSRQHTIFDTIARYGRMSDEHLRLRHEAWREREARKAPHLSAAIESARELGEHARGTGVRLGLECRDAYSEVPSMDEFDQIFAACDGLPIGYWHDAGHGAKLDYAGFLSHEDLLRRHAARMVGMHVHDTRGSRDHQAPGQGDTDFSMLARYLRPETIKTLELHRTVTAEEIGRAVDLLEPLGAFGIREGILIEL